MDRRRFVLAGLSLPWLPQVGSSAVARRPQVWLYDSRFGHARALAAARSGGSDLMPVEGDVTDHWRSLLKPALAAGSLRLSGVTTESFAFCLGVLARDAVGPRARIRLSQTRHDTDLRIWSLEVQTHG